MKRFSSNSSVLNETFHSSATFAQQATQDASTNSFSLSTHTPLDSSTTPFQHRNEQSSSSSPFTAVRGRGLRPQLEKLSVGFPSNAKDVEVLRSPTEFYDRLLLLISQAEKQITLSALYLGTGELEQRLVGALINRAKEKPELKIHIVLDFLRGTRSSNDKGDNSVSALKSLLEQFPSTTRLSLVYMPCEEFPLSYLLKGRNKEILGVHHMKLYMFDDVLLISGANLSKIYFEKRQDRYIAIRNNQAIVDFYTNILDVLTSSSLTCKLSSSSSFLYKQPSPSSADKQNLTQTLSSLMLPPSVPRSELREANTWLFPTLQLGLLNVRHDEGLTQFLLRLGYNSTLHIDLASGYCNFTAENMRIILSSRGLMSVITPSPEANGFWGAQGLSRFVTGAYDFFSRAFLDQVLLEKKQDIVRLYEYFREDWSFHAKGLWLRPDIPVPGGPYVTLVGSSNFGKRSANRDSEAQVCIYTENEGLGQQLMSELRSIKDNCDHVTEEALKNGHIARETPTIPTVLIARAFTSYL